MPAISNTELHSLGLPVHGRIEPPVGRQTDPHRGHSSTTMCRLTGVTYRQLDWWARNNVITPSIGIAHGEGSRRRWGDVQVSVIAALKRLQDAVSRGRPGAGFPLDVLGPIARRLENGETTIDLGYGVELRLIDDEDATIDPDPDHFTPTTENLTP